MKNLKKHLWVFLLLILIGQYFLFQYLPRWERFDDIYNEFWTIKQQIQNKTFGLFSFSVGDVLYAVTAIFLIYAFSRFIVNIFQKDFVAVRRKCDKFLIGFNFIFFLYHILWGLTYNFNRYEKDYNTENITTTELKQYAKIYLDRCIELRSNFNQTKEFQLTRNQQAIGSFFAKDTLLKPNLKKSIYSTFLNYSRISGYYNPFTGEAQYNYPNPQVRLPQTIGHELAHQNGVAREYEATFESFLKGIHSEDLEIKYSTNYDALKSLLTAIHDSDSTFVNTILNQYSLGMQKDRQAEIEFKKKYDLYSLGIMHHLNNLFLIANGQDGTNSYSYFVKLLVGFERKKSNE